MRDQIASLVFLLKVLGQVLATMSKMNGKTSDPFDTPDKIRLDRIRPENIRLVKILVLYNIWEAIF